MNVERGRMARGGFQNRKEKGSPTTDERGQSALVI